MTDDGAVEAVLFDVGGVVLDVCFRRAFVSWARAAGCDPGDLAARFAYEDDTGLAFETGRLEEVAFLPQLRSALGIAIADAALLEGWNAIVGSEIPGIAAVLAEARARWPLYAFSNTNRAHQTFFTARFPALLGNFRKVFTSCDIGLRKPDPAAFRFVLAAIGVPAPRLLFFDDLAVNVEGARACGIRAVRVTSPATVRDTLAAVPR